MATVEERIEQLRQLGQRRRKAADDLEGSAQNPDRVGEEVWPGCMPRPAADGVPYTVAQLRAAYNATRTTKEAAEKNVTRKPRAFFCQALARDDRMWRELLSHPEKYGAGPEVGKSSDDVETLKKRIADLQKSNESCADSLEQAEFETKAFAQRVKELEKRRRKERRARAKIYQNIENVFGESELINLIFKSIDTADPEAVETWRQRLSGEQLKEFNRRLEGDPLYKGESKGAGCVIQ